MRFAIESISTIRNYDYVLIKTEFLQSTNQEFNCGKCLSKYAGRRKDGDEMTRKSRESKNCTTIGRVVHSIPRDGIKFKTCPANFRDLSLNYIFEAQVNYEKGIMPFSGSFFEQPNKIIECFNLIHNMKERYNLEQEEKRRDKNGKRS